MFSVACLVFFSVEPESDSGLECIHRLDSILMYKRSLYLGQLWYALGFVGLVFSC